MDSNVLELSTQEFLTGDFTKKGHLISIREFTVDARGRKYVIEHKGSPWAITVLQWERKHPFVRMWRHDFMYANWSNAEGIQRIEIEDAQAAPIAYRFKNSLELWGKLEQYVLSPDGLRNLQREMRKKYEAHIHRRKISVFVPDTASNIISFKELKRESRQTKAHTQST